MNLAVLLAVALCSQAPAREPELRVTPFVQQGGSFFTSDRVTAAGLGGGAGAQLVWRKRFLAQGDLGVQWLAGNGVVARLAAGVQRDGRWAPAAWATLHALWGERIEILTERGERPAGPTWAVGLRASPLRFTGTYGFASALEPGVGVGFQGGTLLELTVLQVGACW